MQTIISKLNGFGSSVLQMLIKTSIKKNLYYEIKDRIDEEQFDGMTVKRRPKKCKVYGSTSGKNKRNQLIELLHQRVQHHRDKFNSKDIYDELCTMVVKPNGKVEHADDAHDDLVFSYLWALYVFYYGEDLATRFHIMKTEIYTDDHYDETSYSLEEEYGEEGEKLDPSVFADDADATTHMINDQLDYLNKSKRMSMEDFHLAQLNEDEKSLERIRKTAIGRKAISDAYHIPEDYLEKQENNGYTDIGADLNKIWYGDNSKNPANPTLAGNLSDLFNRIN